MWKHSYILTVVEHLFIDMSIDLVMRNLLHDRFH